MMGEAEKIADLEQLDKSLLLPIVILHDVGYSVIGEENPDIKGEKAKKQHMKESAMISRRILNEVDYDPGMTERIVHYISVHDNWLFGDDTPYKECREIAAFNDMDFLWVTTSFDTFKLMAQSMDMSPQEFFDSWIKDEKLTRRPLCCDYTRKMRENSIGNIRKSLKGAQD